MIDFHATTEKRAELDPDAVADDLGPSGVIARAMQQYEDRPAQRDMARAIASLYNDTGVGLIEAGTGVGKSLGYLLPALRWSALTGERTVVSTNTINLQEQLVGKDLPFLADALDGEQEVHFALLKGWRNYLCQS
jgi:ATP-dependent DNA helicase DinG